VPDKKMINVRLSPELWKRAKSAAGERGQTLERWVTDALEAHIAATRGGGASSGAPAANGAADLGDIAWRVSALEQAVDFLAGQLGGGFPAASPAAAAADERE
jgi:hypothetical protein